MINQYGQVFNLKRLHLMSLYRNQHGVLCVRMYQKVYDKRARGYSRSVNKLVAYAFRKDKHIMEQTREQYETELALELERLTISQARNPSEYKEERIKRIKARLEGVGADS